MARALALCLLALLSAAADAFSPTFARSHSWTNPASIQRAQKDSASNADDLRSQAPLSSDRVEDLSDAEIAALELWETVSEFEACRKPSAPTETSIAKQLEDLSDAEIAALELWDTVSEFEACRKPPAQAAAKQLDELSDAEVSALELWEQLDEFEVCKKAPVQQRRNRGGEWLSSAVRSSRKTLTQVLGSRGPKVVKWLDFDNKVETEGSGI